MKFISTVCAAAALAIAAAPVASAQQVIESISAEEMKSIIEDLDATVTGVKPYTNDTTLSGKTSEGVAFEIELGDCSGQGDARRCAEIGYEAAFTINDVNKIEDAIDEANSYDVPVVKEDLETVKCVYFLRLEGGVTRKNLSLATENFFISAEIARDNLDEAKLLIKGPGITDTLILDAISKAFQ